METQKISNSWRTTGIILVSIYVLASVLEYFLYTSDRKAGTLLTFIIISFFLAIKRFGVKDTIVFLVISFLVAWSSETTSVLTGFPFGHYHYTSGPKLGVVPLALGFGYFSPGVFSLLVASALLDKKDLSMKGPDLVLWPLIASFLITMWDLCYDPAPSTIAKGYIWEQGGAYFGVPVSNFLGWVFVAFIIFFLFALYLRRDKRPQADTVIEDKPFWILSIATYLCFAIQAISRALAAKNFEVVAEDGHKFWTGDIHGSLAVVSLFTIVFVSFYAVLRVLRSQRKQAERP